MRHKKKLVALGILVLVPSQRTRSSACSRAPSHRP